MSRRDREQEIKKVERSLAALAIPEDQYLAEDPGHAWDAPELAEIEQKLAAIEDEIEDDEARATALRRSVMSASGIEDDSNWETLLEGLRQKRDEVATEYHALTAQVMAKDSGPQGHLGNCVRTRTTGSVAHLTTPRLRNACSISAAVMSVLT